ncbi:hypothetical protein JavanS165_0004 [Streptococcus satellite phage Javan165]|nr:hypothetical protein JavanS165_0004 [Streptococcus satellite phage Javan165]
MPTLPSLYTRKLLDTPLIFFNYKALKTWQKLRYNRNFSELFVGGN